MVRVTIGNNLERKEEVFTRETTLREALDTTGLNYKIGIINLNGSSLSDKDLDKTFEDFGIEDYCYLLSVVKVDNAS